MDPAHDVDIDRLHREMDARISRARKAVACAVFGRRAQFSSAPRSSALNTKSGSVDRVGASAFSFLLGERIWPLLRSTNFGLTTLDVLDPLPRSLNSRTVSGANLGAESPHGRAREEPIDQSEPSACTPRPATRRSLRLTAARCGQQPE
jgi:hypothetical protein